MKLLSKSPKSSSINKKKKKKDDEKNKNKIALCKGFLCHGNTIRESGFLCFQHVQKWEQCSLRKTTPYIEKGSL
jgi:hypothetical protein